MCYWNDRVTFESLVGKTITEISHVDNYDEVIEFETSDGARYRMSHHQDCCESVRVEEIVGNLTDLINDGPVLLAEEVVEEAENVSESGTWTFYKLRTLNGDVTIRWLGESNGYYSEGVDFVQCEGPRDA